MSDVRRRTEQVTRPADIDLDRRVVITIQHPAHVHFFRNAIRELKLVGYDVNVFTREKDVTIDLLDAYGIDYRVFASRAESLTQLLRAQAQYEYGIVSRVRKLNPDVMMTIGEPAIAHASSLFGSRSILFTDTEHAKLQNALAFPFADLICTPDSYQDDIGSKQFRYPGYHELAYLHPDRFSPDPKIRERFESDGDPLVVLRLVSWTAAHDVKKSGIKRIERLVEGLERAGATVCISSERAVPPSLEDRVYDLPPDRIHDLLAAADLVVGESGTMTIESAVLGTPVIYVSDLDAGVLSELEHRYGLVFSTSSAIGPDRIVSRAVDLLGRDKTLWKRRRRAILAEKIDTTDLMLKLALEATKK